MCDAARQSLAIGFFDGVHLGHQAILRGTSAALTFRNHPLTVLAPERAPRLIMSPDERVDAIRACGVADVTMLDFTPELAQMTAEEFVSRYLQNRKGGGPMTIRCGANGRFGKGGAGDVAFLRRAGFRVEVAPYAEYENERISSSRIRACLERGEIADANAMLGRRFAVSGSRSDGKGVGTAIGYPTINLQIDSTSLRLPLGVYEVEVNGRKGIANYGLAPTMEERAWQTPVLEVHLLSSVLPPSSSLLTVSFVRFIRPERKFDSIAELTRQITADCATIQP